MESTTDIQLATTRPNLLVLRIETKNIAKQKLTLQRILKNKRKINDTMISYSLYSVH